MEKYLNIVERITHGIDAYCDWHFFVVVDVLYPYTAERRDVLPGKKSRKLTLAALLGRKLFL